MVGRSWAMIGTTLGPYKIVEQLGAGGMGEVYVGEDTRLGRKVAIKVLPEEYASDRERLARFEQEARAAAALNHPHIAAVFDVGTEGDIHFMVQEYLEGQSLRERIETGALPLDKALDLATEVGEALIAAHKAGIIHRDLKPDNIFVTEEGHAKVLDFGLAKLTEGMTPPGTSASMSPTMLGTVAGQVMGTAGYMAPEQIQGDVEIDQRADLFAFGCVLYEMIAGKRAFGGETVLDTLHAIARTEPQPLGEIKPDLPVELHRILRKCLAKEAGRRYHVADDVVVDLRQLRDDIAAGVAASVGAEHSAETPVSLTSGMPTKVVVPLVLAVAAIVALVTFFAARRPTAEPGPVVRFEYELPEEARNSSGQSRRLVAISPDGTRIITASPTGLWTRMIDDVVVTPIRGTELGAGPFFSPDGEQLGFWADGELKKLSITGGPPVPLTAIRRAPAGAPSWAEDGNIYFASRDGGIFRVSQNGGEAVPVVASEPERVSSPQLLPDGEWVLFTQRTGGSWDDATIVAAPVAGGPPKELQLGGADGRYVSTGHIVYAREGNLLAVPFDLSAMQPTSGPVSVLEGIRTDAASGVAHYALSDDGGLAYLPSSGGVGGETIVWVDREGVETPLNVSPGVYQFRPAISPDGTKVAVSNYTTGNPDIWIYDIGSDSFTQSTFGGDDIMPVWNADGATIAFSSGRIDAASNDLYIKPYDSTEDPVQIHDEEANTYPVGWAEGHTVFMVGTTSFDIVALDAEGNRVEVVATEFSEDQAALSPDGRWLAYVSNRSGSQQVYVQQFPEPSGRWLISDGQARAHSPRWSPDGGTIFFITGDSMSAASVGLDSRASVEERKALFSTAPYRILRVLTAGYDVHPDDGRFIMIKLGTSSEGSLPRINVVLNWFEELKQRVPTGGR